MQFDKKLHFLLQSLAPQHALSRLAGWFGNCRWVWLKNILINYFIRRYQVDINLATLNHIDDYPTFNHFFTRYLKPGLRPIVEGSHQIASPADGCISQIGKIHQNAIFQAKGFYYSLETLLGNNEALTHTFQNGEFATIYLAPKDYHRVHMPLTGRLRQTIYIPGKLFSVNQQTASMIPNLFTRNERLVCLFDTQLGPMAVILVGAMLVGSIKTIWPLKMPSGVYTDAEGIEIQKGAELGHFKMGSTVIVLFPHNAMHWSSQWKENAVIQMGEELGLIDQH